MTNRRAPSQVPILFALVVAISVISFIKFVLVPKLSQSSDVLSQIWILEVFVLLTIVGAFIFKEILEGTDQISQQDQEKNTHNTHNLSPFHLITSLGASVFIYLAAFTWLSKIS